MGGAGFLLLLSPSPFSGGTAWFPSFSFWLVLLSSPSPSNCDDKDNYVEIYFFMRRVKIIKIIIEFTQIEFFILRRVVIVKKIQSQISKRKSVFFCFLSVLSFLVFNVF